ncbi:rotamase-domain-containing protein [Dacryopinax primogenitus]|uniref:Peptidyl-prolyl cis-trans isomerase n=1 Tax=Dacryopinax primogenitus (strain DJM 731) TaxID=1858805 RepID=M5G9S9_DACPD|nr:rotamase-domain-containing protein [Dacryopinax primogenitus]EJU02632.1 rotamase-domain-containing protein [Dacryopinax primogenitus]
MSGWEVRFSNTRKAAYFHNVQTRESTWEPPSHLSDAQLRALPGSEYLVGGVGAGGGAQTNGENEQVRASHLLVKHSGSRRPSSWKNANITLPEAEAREILQGYANTIGQDPVKFAQLASEYSDDSSHERGGDLGVFSRGQMQRPFEEATFALKVGEISGIVKTDSGLHLIMRTG